MTQLFHQQGSARRLLRVALLCALFSTTLLLWLIHERPERDPASYQALTQVMARSLSWDDAITEPQMTAVSPWAVTPERVTMFLFFLCLANALAAIILGLLLRRRFGPSATVGSVVALAAVVAVLAISFQTGFFNW